MGLERIRKVSAVIPVTPRRIYDAWLSADEHAAFTGAAAQISPRKGQQFTAHDGYISGSNLELERGTRIVQAWRTSDFPEDAEDSQLEITFIQSETGTRVVINHGGIPEGQGERYHSGWSDHYFKPLLRYFLNRRDSPEVLARAARRAESSDDQAGSSSSLGTIISARQPRATTPAAPTPDAARPKAESVAPEAGPQASTRRRAPADAARAAESARGVKAAPAPAPRAVRGRAAPSAAAAKPVAPKLARATTTKTTKTTASKPQASSAGSESKARTRKPVRRKGTK